MQGWAWWADLSIQETEAGVWGVQGQHELLRELRAYQGL